MSIPLVNPQIIQQLRQAQGLPPLSDLSASAAPVAVYAAAAPGIAGAAAPALAGAAAAAGASLQFDFQAKAPRVCSEITIYNAGAPHRLLIKSSKQLAPCAPDLLSRAEGCYGFAQDVDRFSRSVLKCYPTEARSIDVELDRIDVDDNAFWSSTAKAVRFGSYGLLFERMDLCDTIMFHELGHSVVDCAGGLQYAGQSGALNESVADVFGIMVKHRKEGGKKPNVASWLIGENLVLGNFSGPGALRDMSNPGGAHAAYPPGFNGAEMRDGQVGRMDQFIVTPDNSLAHDFGAVHSNSGIPSKAFYNAVIRDGKPSYERIGKVWMGALEAVSSTADFVEFANATIASSKKLYARSGNITQTVYDGWRDVQVNVNAP